MAWHKLTGRKIDSLRKPGWYGDGGGLWLQVGPTGGKSWLFRYTRSGRARAMGLGPLDLVSLAEAREKARDARRLIGEGRDPLDVKRDATAAARARDATTITFRSAAESYITAHAAGWRNAKHAEQWRATLEAYAYPVIGDLAVDAIGVAEVMTILEPAWSTKTETASRVRGRIEAVLDWATARHYRHGDNPARWKGHLDKLLPAKAKVAKVRHQPALPWAEVPDFLAELRALTSISAKALDFTVLTAARTGEVIGARWPEIDFAAKLWTIPGERMKAGREHRVPLSTAALGILAGLPREGDGDGWIWPGARAGRPLSNMAMLEMLRGLRPGLTVHGFRSSFRDWAAEATNFPRDLAEAALAHVVKDKTERAYRRGDALEKRRRLMDAWARFCGSPVKAGGVVAIGRARS